MSNKKKSGILIIVAVIVAIIIGVGLVKYSSTKESNQKDLNDLKEQKIQLETQQNEVFMEDGFSEEYYRIHSELAEVNKQIQNKESSSGPATIFFTIFGLMFVVIFGMAFINIFRNIKNVHKLVDSNTNSMNINQTETDQMEKMANMLGKVAVNMAKEMNPEYKSLKCPNCGAALADDVEVCEYCDAPLTKVVAQKK